MKVTVTNPKEFADAVAWAARALNSRPSVPTLSGILVEARDNLLVLSAFDYDVTARAEMPADVAEPGRVLLSGRVLAEVAKNLPSQQVELALSDTEVTITCGGSEAVLPTMPVEHYPTLPKPPQTVGAVDGALLKAAVAQVSPAADRDSAVAQLRCVKLDAAGDILTLAATDNVRLAVRDLTWQPSESGAEYGVLVPADILHEVARGFGPQPIRIGIGEGIAGFESAGRTTTIRLIAEEYPKYRHFVEMDLPVWANVDTAPLLDAARRVAPFAEKSMPIRLDFTQGAVTVRAVSDSGRGSEAVAAELDGEALEVSFQSHALLGALAVIDHQTVRIGMTVPGKPALFVGGDEGLGCRVMVMPLRVS